MFHLYSKIIKVLYFQMKGLSAIHRRYRETTSHVFPFIFSDNDRKFFGVPELLSKKTASCDRCGKCTVQKAVFSSDQQPYFHEFYIRIIF